MATAAQLIDYLHQFPPEIEVVCNDDDFEKEGDYISLQWAIINIDEDEDEALANESKLP